MRSHKKYIIYILAFCFSINLYAVQTVYRVDSEAPATVFQNGLSAQQSGGNSNLLAYLEGTSIRFANSGLLVTYTRDTNLNFFSAPTIYIYTIRADAHFYDVNLSLSFCRNNPPSRLAHIVCASLLNNPIYQSENLFVVQNIISASNIESAIEFNYNQITGEYVPGAVTNNPNYQPLGTQSNPYPYPITEEDASNLYPHLGLILAEPQPNQPVPNRGLPLGACPIRRHASMKSSKDTFLKGDENFGCKYLQFYAYPITAVLF